MSATPPMHSVRLRGRPRGARWLVYAPPPPSSPREIKQVDIERRARASLPRCIGECGRPEPIEPTPIAECGGSGCTLELAEGSYRLEVAGSWEIARYSEGLPVYSDLDLEVRAPHRLAKWGGVALATTGGATLLVGSWMLLLVPMMSLYEQCEDDCWTQGQAALAAGGLIVGGGGMGVLGVLMVERNTRIRVRPARIASVAARPVALGLTPLDGGLGLGARMSF